MRNLLLAILTLSLLATMSGCMVLDELDTAAAKMPSSGKKAAASEAAQDEPESIASARENPLLQKSKQWWNEAKSLAPTGLESAIVSCRLRGGTQFMSKDDCLARGGAPGRV